MDLNELQCPGIRAQRGNFELVNAQESVVPDFPHLHSYQKVLFFFLKGFLALKSRELFMEVGSGGLCLLH